MQRIFHMTTDGILQDPVTGVRHEPACWPGRIVAVCPLQFDEVKDDIRYLAVVEGDAVPLTIRESHTAHTLAHATGIEPIPVFRTHKRSPLRLQQTRHLWFQCARSR